METSNGLLFILLNTGARRPDHFQNPFRQQAVARNSEFDRERHGAKPIDALLVIKLAAAKHVAKTDLDVLQSGCHSHIDIGDERPLVDVVTLAPGIPIQKNVMQHEATVAATED